MTEVTNEVFNEDKNYFFTRHNWDYEIRTSPLENDGSYIKTYSFADGANWYEKVSPLETVVTATSHGVQFDAKVKLCKTDYWSSDISRERTYFELW